MAALIRFLAVVVALAAVFVLIVLPLALGPLLTQAVRDMGLKAETLEVTVAPFDPTLILGRAKRVNIRATGVDVAPGRIESFELALGEASLFDRSFETVSGRLGDVSVTVGGESFSASEISVEGPADAAAATARMTAAETEQLVRAAAQRVGVTVDDVQLTESGVNVAMRGHEASAAVNVRGGALLLVPDAAEAIVLIQPAPSDPWQLEEAWISDQSLNVRGRLDVDRLLRDLVD